MPKARCAIALCVLPAVVGGPASARAADVWSPVASMATPRYLHEAIALPNGKVLVSGGYTGSDFSASAELYDPAIDSWSPTGSMSVPRYVFASVLLGNGKVLVAGGYRGGTSASSYHASAELYDPVIGTWSPAATMSASRYRPTATLLANGKVLVVGGAGPSLLASAELYDPAADSWTAAGSMAVARWEHTATLLANGDVLVAGGGASLGPSASAEIYHPATGTWSSAASMTTARQVHTATRLANGDVLVAGGETTSGNFTASAERYHPATDTWTPVPSMSVPRAYATATTLAGGAVLVAGGFTGSDATATVESYDPASSTWSPLPSMAGARLAHRATLLAGGRLLVTGGFTSANTLRTAEIYGPPNVVPPPPPPPPPPPGGDYPSEVAADGPLHWWRLGEPSGAAMTPAAGGITGSYRNGVGLAQPAAAGAAPNTAAAFDGAGSYAYVNGIAAPTAAYTIEILMRADAPTRAGSLIDHGGAGALYVNPDRYCFRQTTTHVCWPVTPLPAVWHHVAGTWDAVSKVARLYVDGVLRASATAPAAPSGSSTLYIGYGQSAPWFDGLLDEPAYYPTVLSPARIAAHHAACAC